MLFFHVGFAQFDFTNLSKLLKNNEKLLGKEYVIAINKDGKNIFLKETEDFKLKSSAQIANCSKWLTSAVVMTFVDAGKINLDDPVSKYIPIFEKYLKGYITIRHCLSETTGIEGESQGVLKIVKKDKFENLEEEVNYFAAKRLIEDNPGTHFSYSSVGLNIAARVIEVITKKTFDKIAQEKIFKPLGMKSTSLYNEEAALNPAGTITSSANDYLVFMQMILNKGIYNGKRILSESSVQAIETLQYPDAKKRFTPDYSSGFAYGMGCWIQEKDLSGNGNIFSCPGITGTWPWIDTDRKYVAVIFMQNSLNEQKIALYQKVKQTIESAIGK